jgi:hypothetical protein
MVMGGGDGENHRSPWAKSETIAIPDAPASNPMGFFENVRAERRPSYGREEWSKVCIVCTPMIHKPTGRTPTFDEMREAAKAASDILLQHFPEGPRGAEKAQKAYCHWLDKLGSEPRPATARWQAAMREIASLERDETQPNYLAHIDPIHGVDFSGIGRGLNLGTRYEAREQAKIWSALSWKKTPEGSFVLSRNNCPMARLVPNRHEQIDNGWFSFVERRFEKLDYGIGGVDFKTRHEGKAFLEWWAIRIPEREFRRCRGRSRDDGLGR